MAVEALLKLLLFVLRICIRWLCNVIPFWDILLFRLLHQEIFLLFDVSCICAFNHFLQPSIACSWAWRVLCRPQVLSDTAGRNLKEPKSLVYKMSLAIKNQATFAPPAESVTSTVPPISLRSDNCSELQLAIFIVSCRCLALQSALFDPLSRCALWERVDWQNGNENVRLGCWVLKRHYEKRTNNATTRTEQNKTDEKERCCLSVLFCSARVVRCFYF